MTVMWGIFNDEGCVENEFFSQGEAQKALWERYYENPYEAYIQNVYVAECCPDHPEEERETCGECMAEPVDPDDPIV